MKNIIKSVTLKQYILICIGRFFDYALKKVAYRQYYESLYRLILFYNNLGYKFKKTNEGLIIIGKENFKNYQFLLRPHTSDNKVFNQVIENIEYLSAIQLVEDHFQKDSVNLIIDAGANIGLTTLYLSYHFPNAKFICIEAENENFKQLQKNIHLNSFQNIHLINMALWNSSAELLAIDDNFRDGKSWSKTVVRKSETDCRDLKTIPSISLNEIIHNYNLEIIDLLKIDIEGGEKELFKDEEFLKTLKNKVRFLALEIHDETGMRELIKSKLSVNRFILFDVGETTFAYNESLITN